MMNNQEKLDVDTQVKRLLTEAFYDSEQKYKPILYRRIFSGFLFATTPFFGVLALMMIHRSIELWSTFFAICAVLCVIVGFWQFFKANREESAPSFDAEPPRPSKGNGVGSIRRIK